MNPHIIRRAKEAALDDNIPFGRGVEATKSSIILTVLPIELEVFSEDRITMVLTQIFASYQLKVHSVEYAPGDLIKISINLRG